MECLLITYHVSMIRNAAQALSRANARACVARRAVLAYCAITHRSPVNRDLFDAVRLSAKKNIDDGLPDNDAPFGVAPVRFEPCSRRDLLVRTAGFAEVGGVTNRARPIGGELHDDPAWLRSGLRNLFHVNSITTGAQGDAGRVESPRHRS